MKFRQYLLLALKGCAMGSADVVPGVSGGTIAFISGIYDELIDSIRSFDAEALRLLVRGRFAALWHHVNGRFLLPVAAGIGVAVFSLARLMTYLLEHRPIEIRSFFFGLIVASALLMAKEVGRWGAATGAAFVAGCVAAWWITVATPAQTPDAWWFVMLSGAIAICAMILPGISGAFILLLLGKYDFIMRAVSELNLPVLALFLIGAAVGIVSFSHLLSWLLKHRRDVTVATLVGFMVGSLNKVWPWRVSLVEESLAERNVLPGTFEATMAQDGRLWLAAALCAAGFLTIWGIERIAAAVSRKRGA